ncbi:hypothetical protein ACJZ2D_000941 [Fusarium nematophilum]
MRPRISPSFKDSVIHDNACGAGAVTQCIMATQPSKGIHVDVTDINPQFVAGCAELERHHDWPMEAQIMDAKCLKFPDDRFTHSFNSLALHCMGDASPATTEVHRTLKTNGVAIDSIWVDMPLVDALKHAHWRTRGRNGPMPVLLEDEDFLQADLKIALQNGGFKPGNILFHEKPCFVAIPDLERWAQLAWSYLGALPSGWNLEDEEKWDEAVLDIVEQLRNGRGLSRNDKGELTMKLVACVAVATK